MDSAGVKADGGVFGDPLDRAAGFCPCLVVAAVDKIHAAEFWQGRRVGTRQGDPLRDRKAVRTLEPRLEIRELRRVVLVEAGVEGMAEFAGSDLQRLRRLQEGVLMLQGFQPVVHVEVRLEQLAALQALLLFRKPFVLGKSLVAEELRRHFGLLRGDVSQTELVAALHGLGFDRHSQRGAEILLGLADVPEAQSASERSPGCNHPELSRHDSRYGNQKDST